MSKLQKLLTRRWRGKSHFAAFMLAATAAATAWSATPLAVWNGDFNTATTRNGVTFDVNGNTVNEDGTVTISSSGSGGIKFTVDKTYNYITTVFTVKNLDESAASDRVLVALGGSTGYYTGVYLKSGGLSTGGVNGNSGAWDSTKDTYGGTVSSVADANTTRTFAATQVNAGTLQNGFHLYEDVGNGTSGGTIVYGGNGNNGLYGTQTYDKVLIGGGLSGSTGLLASMTDLVVVSVAIYVSDAGWPLDSAGRQNFVMPVALNVGASTTISALNAMLTQANITGPTFVNLGVNIYLTADVTPATNLVFPYDTTIALDGTTLTVTGGMPVKPGSAITSIDGSGTVIYTSTDKLPGAGTFASTWTGTVWLNGGTRNGFVPGNLGNANSALRFTDVIGYPSKAQHSTGVPKYELVNGTAGYALYMNNGYSCDYNGGYSYTRTPKLLGSGTLRCDGSAGSVLLIVDDWSDFTGALTLTNKSVWFGVEPPTSTGSGIDILASGTIGIGAGKTLVANSTKLASWTYSGFVGSGTVEVSASDTGSTDTRVCLKGSSTTAIVLKGLKGKHHIIPFESHTIEATVRLDGDVTINSGSTGATYTFAKLTGSGKFTNTFNEYFVFSDVSEYKGTLASSGYNMTVGVPTAPAVGDLIAKVDSMNNKVSTTIMQTNAVGYPFAGELKLDGVYGLYATAKATVGSTGYPTVAAALNAAKTADAVVLNMTGETVSVDSISVTSLTVNGTGEITVSGDVNVSGAVTFTPDSSYTLYNTYGSTYYAKGYTLKLMAGGMSAGTLNGAAAIVTTRGLTAAGGTFYGKVTGDISSSGNFTLQAPQTVSSELNVTAGTLTVGPRVPSSYGLHLDASDTSNMTITDGSLTAFTTPNGASTRTWSSTGTAYATVGTDENYFGGTKPVMVFNANAEYAYTSGNLRYGTLFAVYQTNQEAPSSDTENVLFTSRNSEANDKIRFGIYKSGYQTSRSKWYGWNNSSSQASNYTWPIFLDGSNSSTSFTTGKKSVLSFATSHPGPSSRGIQIGCDAVTFVGAVAEIIGLGYTVSLEERAAIEAYLMQKWDCTDKANFTMLASTAEVTLSSGSTLDLGGYAQTVKSLSGSGTVQNGTLTVTDDISLSAGDVLTLPSTAEFTPDTVAAKIVDTTAGTITLCGSVQDAIDNYTSGTLTILASETVTVAKEVTISGIVVADGAELTLTQVPPFTATFENGTLTSTRSAATFVYTGDTAYSPVSGNFTIGGVATPVVPGTSDTVQFDTATSIYIGNANIQYAAFVLNADVTVTGAGTNYLRVNRYTGTGALKLAGNGNLAPQDGSTTTIECPVDISGDNILRVPAQNDVTTIKGKLTGSGKWKMSRVGGNTGYSGNIFRCDASKFTGTIEELPCDSNVSRNFTRFGAPNGSNVCDFSGATVTLNSNRNTDKGKFLWVNTSSVTYKFGSLKGKVTSTASEYTDDQHCYIEIGALGDNDELTGDWISGNEKREPYLRKVGTGTLTTSVTDTYGYILNGGTLVVMAAAAQKEVTTELAGYEVVSEVTYDTDGVTVLSTTYTLKSNKITWTGKGADSNWTTAGNWSGNAVPTETDFVVFEDDAEVVVPTWTTSKCKYMTVNGNVTLAGAELTGNCYCLDVYGGYIDGTGTLTLKNCGLWNATTSANVVISVDVAVESTGNRAQFSRIESDNGTFTLTGDVAVGEGAKLKLKNATATEPEISLGVGGWLVVPSNSSVTTGNIVVSGSTYFQTTDGTDTAYVNNTASKWIGGSSGNWLDSANWSSGVYPRDDTDVTFEAGDGETPASYTVYVGNGNWDEGNRDKCKNMVVDGYLTLAAKDSADGCHLSMFGDASGRGLLTLSYCGLDNGTWNPARNLTIGTKFCVASGNRSQFTNRNIGFNVTGEAEFWGNFLVGGPSTFDNLALKDDVTVTIYNSWTGDDQAFHQKGITVANLSVASGAQATLAYGDANAATLDATITGTVTLEGADSTLTVPANANVSGAKFVCGVNGYKVVGPTANVYSVDVDTNITPGGTSIGYDSKTDATAAAAGYTVVLTTAQEEQGLQAGYYKTSVAYDSETGKWVVTAALNESVVGGNLVETAAVDVSTGKVTLGVGAANLKPGLCYRIVSGNDPVSMKAEDEVEWSDYYNGSNAPTLTADLPTGSAPMYYSVEASDTK